MFDYAEALRRVISDPRYERNLDWGKPRSGHPEGTVRAHIAELESNLAVFKSRLSETEIAKLTLLIHTHDTFKADAKSGVPIADPRSHASLSRAFLGEFCPDEDLLAMVQYHDEPYALWQRVRRKGAGGERRLAALCAAISDWNLFLAFVLIDGCTAGKSREPLQWLFCELAGKVQSTFSEADILW